MDSYKSTELPSTPGNTKEGAKKSSSNCGVSVGKANSLKVRLFYIRIFPNIGQPPMKTEKEERIIISKPDYR